MPPAIFFSGLGLYVLSRFNSQHVAFFRVGFAAQALLFGFGIFYDLLLGFEVWQPTPSKVLVYHSMLSSRLWHCQPSTICWGSGFSNLHECNSCSLGFRAVSPAIFFSGLGFFVLSRFNSQHFGV